MGHSGQAAERETRRDYCRGCGAAGVQRFAHYATEDGHENSIRPRAFYRRCAACGTLTLALADAHDAEGLCRAVLRDWLSGLDTSARVGPTGAPTADGRIDAGEALGWMQERVWHLYTLWNPSRMRFTAYATHYLRQGVRQWAADASGEATDRAHGRRVPKAHAASVSTSYDGLMEAAGGAEHLDLGETTQEHASPHAREAIQRAPLETRRLVVLLYCGYSQVEAAARIGIAPARAGALLGRLRRELAAET